VLGPGAIDEIFAGARAGEEVGNIVEAAPAVEAVHTENTKESKMRCKLFILIYGSFGSID